MKAMTTNEVIASAAACLGGPMMSSATLCLEDARALQGKGDLGNARKRAIDSLAYSVGRLAPAYANACA